MKEIKGVMMIGLCAMYVFISKDIMKHMQVLGSLSQSATLFHHNGLTIELALHAVMLVFQCQYSCMLVNYTFYLLYSQKAFLNVIINCAALAILNQLDDWVCNVMKQFLTAKDEPLFIVIKRMDGDEQVARVLS